MSMCCGEPNSDPPNGSWMILGYVQRARRFMDKMIDRHFEMVKVNATNENDTLWGWYHLVPHRFFRS